jgi:hypothetical protein
LHLDGVMAERTPRLERLARRAEVRMLARRWQAEQVTMEEPGRLERHEHRVNSQNGEDGILAEIFERIDVTNRYVVEIGAADGEENCTRALVDRGWRGLWVEADESKAARARQLAVPGLAVESEFVTPASIPGLIQRHSVPSTPDLVSVDIDGDDLAVARALLDYLAPRVLILEYNSAFGAQEHAVPGARSQGWDHTFRYGASLSALSRLAAMHGLQLVGCNSTGVNAFFVRAVDAAMFTRPGSLEAHHHGPWFSPFAGGHPRSRRAVTTSIPALADHQLSGVEVALRRTGRPGGRGLIAIEVSVANNSGVRIASGGRHPVVLSVGWVCDVNDPPVEHAPRVPLASVIPHTAERSTFLLVHPSEDPHRRTLRVEVLQEGVAWASAVGRSGRAHLRC